MNSPGPCDGAPSPAQEAIAALIASAPAFSAADVAQPSGPAEGEQPAKRGRGRPKGGASAGPVATSGDGSPPPSPPDDGAAWPFGFEMRENGLWHCPKNDNPAWLCGPFEVLGMVRTAESGAWALYARFEDPDGNEQSLAISYAELQGDGATVRRALADRGLSISGKKGSREKLIEALAGVRTPHRLLLVSQTGWHADGKCFALPHLTIAAPDAEAVVFEGRARGAHFATAGDLAGWHKVAVLAVRQDRLLLALGLALSGPLLEPLGLDGGGFHFVGGSSIGKTSAERLGGSVWGGGGAIGFAQSWRATANALEGVATSHNDCFLALDEIGLCEPHDLGAAAYALAGGQGKGRMRSDAEMRNRSRWRPNSLVSKRWPLGSGVVLDRRAATPDERAPPFLISWRVSVADSAEKIVRKSVFASMCGVTPARVSQWLSEGKLTGEALVGEGRTAKINVAVAIDQLKGRLDASQRFGLNGLSTRLTAASAPPPEELPFETPPDGVQPPPLDMDESVVMKIQTEKLRQAQLLT